MPSLSPTVKNAPQETNNRKQADKKTSQATLQIAASSAIATRLMYQEHLIVERLHRILGYDVIKGISVKHESGLDNRSYGHALPRKLDKAERAYLNSALENVEDAAVKKLLESLGEKILLDHRR